jgi:hypothetical protein
MESSIHVLDHVTYISFVLSHKLKNFSVFLLKWPISKLLNFPILYFINSQELLIMLFVVLKEAGFANKASGVLTLWMYADIHDISTLVTLQKTFRSHRPFSFVNSFIYLFVRGGRFFVLLLFGLFVVEFGKRERLLSHIFIYLLFIVYIK